MPQPLKRPRRAATHIRTYDYSQPGIYFVTTCVQDKACLLGEVVGGEFLPNAFGILVQEYWIEVQNHFAGVVIDPVCVLPNHAHALITILASAQKRASLGQIIAYYKYQTTKEINLIRGSPGVKFWQRDYYEHIIRNEVEHTRVYDYIQTNAQKWEQDHEYTQYL